tara:strand:+ start:605 stop:1402 length:798 start_codon:yes stop_codon:yes gene_type:complete
MINEIPNRLIDFDIFIEKPIYIFEKKNFFEIKDYNELRNNFPKEQIFPGFHDKGEKIFLNNKHEEFYKFIENNIWGKFYNFLNRKEFIILLIDLISPQIKKIENRKNFKKYYYNNKFSNTLFNKVKKKLLKIANYENIRLGFEFSIIKKNCYIPPHCDTENKLLSLMIYFPPEEKLAQKNDIHDYGTNFYNKKDGAKENLDIWESKYLDKNNSHIFFENYEVFYKSKFEENKLVGFIKNDKSWHDVSIFEKNILRKSLNINLYIE